MFPHCLSRGGDIKLEDRVGVLPGDFDARLLILLPPRLLEVAQPELNFANDVDGFVMLHESLRRRVDAHRLDAGVAVKCVGAAADLLAHRVFEEFVDEYYVTSGKLFAPAHLLFHRLAVVDNELEIKIAHRCAGVALASRGLLNVAEAPAELEIGRLDNVLQHRAVDLRGRRVDESGVALELGKAERRSQTLPGGRQAGTPNKFSAEIRWLIRAAAHETGYVEEVEVLDAEGKPTGKFEDKVIEEGELGYLKWLARYHPSQFAPLYGRVVPLEMNLKTETKVNVKYETVEEVRAGLLERGMPLKMIEAMEAAMEPKFETQRLPKPPDQVQ